MPEFTLHRNFLLRTTKGHTIRFEKDSPVYVPPVCVPDAVAIGAQAVEEASAQVLPDETPEPPPLTPDQRKVKIREAIEMMIGRNERSDFTASGLPDLRKLNPLVGFDVSTREREEVWMALKAEQAEDL